jgi:general secretion pathway protein H
MLISRITISNDRGFSLAELAVVVFIIALSVSLTLPLISERGDADLHTAGRRLAGTIKHLYNEAVLGHMEHRLSLDLDRRAYRADRHEENGEWKAVEEGGRERRLPGTVEISEIYVVGRGAVTSGEISMQIYPAGWLDETVIHLKDGKHLLTLRVSALTGTTDFFDGHRDFR